MLLQKICDENRILYKQLFYRCEELQLELAASQRSRMGTGVPVAPMTGNIGGQSWSNKGTEIERIMAKIEQDNRILAELDHSRSTTLGKLEIEICTN